jgi:hypothetical protein
LFLTPWLGVLLLCLLRFPVCQAAIPELKSQGFFFFYIAQVSIFSSSVFFSADSVLILRAFYMEISLQKVSTVCQIHASIFFPLDDLGFLLYASFFFDSVGFSTALQL